MTQSRKMQDQSQFFGQRRRSNMQHPFSTSVCPEALPRLTGASKTANRSPHPRWYGTNHHVVPPGKANPLGTRWMGLNHRGYGIHGTNNQHSIGQNVSPGCIRMRKADVEELF